MSSTHALNRLQPDNPQSFSPLPTVRRHAKRLNNWDRRLDDSLQEWSPRAFKWGSADCVHFVFDCVERMTGTAYLAGIETYSCERQALKVLASINRCGLLQAVETLLGPAEDIEPEAPAFQRGDVVMTMRTVIGAPTRRGPGLGICDGPTAFFVGAGGLETIPVENCLYGWRI